MMSRNLSEDEIRVIDSRGRYSIRKGVVWAVVLFFLLVFAVLSIRISRQTRFIAELTSGQTVSTQTVNVAALDKIRVVEVNGAGVNFKVGPGNLRLIYWALNLVPEKYTSDAQKDLKRFYKLFKRRIGSQHLTEFNWGILHVKASYKNGKAYRYEFSNSKNDYSLTVLCSYDELVRMLDRVVK